MWHKMPGVAKHMLSFYGFSMYRLQQAIFQRFIFLLRHFIATVSEMERAILGLFQLPKWNDGLY